MKDLIRKDILLQWRQGFWLVYFIVSCIYIIILLNIPAEHRMIASLIMILSDTTMLGVLFIGAVILLEKQQSVIHSLFVTPLKPSHYILSKSISLSLIAITMSILVYLPVGTVSVHTFLILGTTILTAGIFVMFGIGIATKVTTINQYFGRLMLFSILILIPVVPYLIMGRHPAFLILPYIASLDIMLAPLSKISALRILIDLVMLLAWGYIMYRYSLFRVKKHLVFT